MIVARGLTKTYGEKTAVDGIDFTVEPGRVTGFLGPNGAGKSTTMRMILGLDRPTAGSVTVNGRRYADSPAPLREVGALLEARALHPGRSARDHLRWLAASNGIPAAPGRRGARPGRPRRRSPASGSASSPSAWASGSASPSRCSATRRSSSSTSRSTGWTPRASAGCAPWPAQLAAEGRTVFVSSHLMSEMALTADHLVVIGRGRILADCSMSEFIADHAASYVRVRSPQRGEVADLLRRQGLDVAVHDEELRVQGLDAAAIGELVGKSGLLLHELTLVRSSLEDAFMTLTADSVEYHARHARRDRPMTVTADLAHRRPRPEPRTSPASGARASPTRCAPSGSSSGPCARRIWSTVMLFVLGAGLTVAGLRDQRRVAGQRRGRRVPGLLRHLGDDVRPDHRDRPGHAGGHQRVRHRDDPRDAGRDARAAARCSRPRRSCSPARCSSSAPSPPSPATSAGNWFLDREGIGIALERRRRAAGHVRQRPLHGRARAVRRGGRAAGPAHRRRAVRSCSALVFVVGNMVFLLPGDWGEWIGKLMPGNAGLRRRHRRCRSTRSLLDPWIGFAVFAGEVAVVLLVGWLVLPPPGRLTRRVAGPRGAPRAPPAAAPGTVVG